MSDVVTSFTSRGGAREVHWRECSRPDPAEVRQGLFHSQRVFLALPSDDCALVSPGPLDRPAVLREFEPEALLVAIPPGKSPCPEGIRLEEEASSPYLSLYGRGVISGAGRG
jgi:hypothetical protein